MVCIFSIMTHAAFIEFKNKLKEGTGYPGEHKELVALIRGDELDQAVQISKTVLSQIVIPIDNPVTHDISFNVTSEWVIVEQEQLVGRKNPEKVKVPTNMPVAKYHAQQITNGEGLLFKCDPERLHVIGRIERMKTVGKDGETVYVPAELRLFKVVDTIDKGVTDDPSQLNRDGMNPFDVKIVNTVEDTSADSVSTADAVEEPIAYLSVFIEGNPERLEETFTRCINKNMLRTVLYSSPSSGRSSKISNAECDISVHSDGIMLQIPAESHSSLISKLNYIPSILRMLEEAYDLYRDDIGFDSTAKGLELRFCGFVQSRHREYIYCYALDSVTGLITSYKVVKPESEDVFPLSGQVFDEHLIGMVSRAGIASIQFTLNPK